MPPKLPPLTRLSLVPLPATITSVSLVVPVTLTSPPQLLTSWRPARHVVFSLVTLQTTKGISTLTSPFVPYSSPDTSYLTSWISPTPPPLHLLQTLSWRLYFDHLYLSVFPFPVGSPVHHRLWCLLPRHARHRCLLPRHARHRCLLPRHTAPVPSTAPLACPVLPDAPHKVSEPSTTPRTTPVPPTVPRAAPTPPARYTEPVQVYWRRPMPPPTQAPPVPAPEVPAHYAPPMRYVYERRLCAMSTR
jgi:hypothetical protein